MALDWIRFGVAKIHYATEKCLSLMSIKHVEVAHSSRHAHDKQEKIDRKNCSNFRCQNICRRISTIFRWVQNLVHVLFYRLFDMIQFETFDSFSYFFIIVQTKFGKDFSVIVFALIFSYWIFTDFITCY